MTPLTNADSTPTSGATITIANTPPQEACQAVGFCFFPSRASTIITTSRRAVFAILYNYTIFLHKYTTNNTEKQSPKNGTTNSKKVKIMLDISAQMLYNKDEIKKER